MKTNVIYFFALSLVFAISIVPTIHADNVHSVTVAGADGKWEDSGVKVIFDNPLPGNALTKNDTNQVHIRNAANVFIDSNVTPANMTTPAGVPYSCSTISVITVGDNLSSNATFFAGTGNLTINGDGYLDTTPFATTSPPLAVPHIRVVNPGRNRGGSIGNFLLEGNGTLIGGDTWVGRANATSYSGVNSVNNASYISGTLILKDNAVFKACPISIGSTASVITLFKNANATYPTGDITGLVHIIGSNVTTGISSQGALANTGYQFNSSGTLQFTADADGVSTLDLLSNATASQILTIESKDTTRNRAFTIVLDLENYNFGAVFLANASATIPLELVKIRGFAGSNTFLTGGGVTLSAINYNTTSFIVTFVEEAIPGGYVLKANITMNPAAPPTISPQPQSQELLGGDNATFSIIALGVGSANYTYQWKKDGANIVAGDSRITGFTSNSLVITNASASDSGVYSIAVTNPVGNALVNSDNAMLTVKPLEITQHPTGQSIYAGFDANFTVTANANDTNFTYQWLHEGVTPVGATQNLSITNAQSANAGNYCVRITNAYGNMVSSNAVLSINSTAPIITILPADQSANADGTVTFVSEAEGPIPFTYEWKKAGNATVLATTANLTLTNVQAATHNGTYTVTVSNSFGNNSASANLSVYADTAPNVLVQPQASISMNQGETQTISAVIAGAVPMDFQWKKDGVAIPGATSSSYIISVAAPSDAGNYTLTVTNARGTITTQAAKVTISGRPFELITPWYASSGSLTFTNEGVAFGTESSAQHAVTHLPGGNASLLPSTSNFPVPVQLAVGDSIDISAQLTMVTVNYTKSGNAAMRFGFFSSEGKSGNIFVANTNPVVSSPGYVVQFNNAASSGTSNFTMYRRRDVPTATGSGSNGALLTNSTSYTNTIDFSPTPVPQDIFSGPFKQGETYRVQLSIVRAADNTANFAVKLSGGHITPGTTYTYNVTHIGTSADPAVLRFDTIGFSAYGSAGPERVRASNIVWHYNQKLDNPPFFTSQPANLTVTSGSLASIPTVVRSAVDVTYQWFKGTPPSGVVIPGQNNATLSIEPAEEADAGTYYLAAENIYGVTYSNPVELSITPGAPRIITQPQAQTVAMGQSATLSAFLGGTQPIDCQWLKNGVPIPGAITDTYTIPSTVLADTAYYIIRLTNPEGTTHSDSVRLSVEPPPPPAGAPTFTKVPPAEINLVAGKTLSLSASAKNAVNYQWYFDDVPIAGQTKPSLSLPKADETNTGLYYLKASNANGDALTPATIVWVGDAPKIISNLPSSDNAGIGAPYTMNITATGTSPLTYQWYFNSKPIEGAAQPFYTIANATLNDTGSYYIKVTNPGGVATSKTLKITVQEAPVFQGDAPFRLYVAQNGTLSIPVSVRSKTTLSYEWATTDSTAATFVPLSDTNGYSGTKTRSLKIKKADKAIHQSYYVVKASNMAGSIVGPKSFGSPIYVWVGKKPVFTQNLKTAEPAVYATATVPITVKVDAGSLDDAKYLSFRWYKDGKQIAMTTNNSSSPGASGDYTANPVAATFTANVSGTYKVNAINPLGQIISKSCKITIHQAPSITKNLPEQLNITTNSTLSLAVKVSSSTQPVTYTWFYRPDQVNPYVQIINGNTVTGATTGTLKIAKAQEANTGYYYVQIDNPVSVANSSLSITSTVSDVWVGTAPKISMNKTASVEEGGNITLTPTITGTGSLNYKWLKNSANITSASISSLTNDTLVINSAQTTDVGSYTITVANRLKSVKSSALKLTITPPSPSPAPLPAPIALLDEGIASLAPHGNDAENALLRFNPALNLQGDNNYSIWFIDSDNADTTFCMINPIAGTFSTAGTRNESGTFTTDAEDATNAAIILFATLNGITYQYRLNFVTSDSGTFILETSTADGVSTSTGSFTLSNP